MRYKLRLKASDNIVYTDKTLRLEHKDIIALARNLFSSETGFAAENLAEFTYENEETVSVYLRELDKACYITRVSDLCGW